MSLSAVTLLSLVMSPGQLPADTVGFNRPDMKIPIDYNPAKKAEIRELILYVSADQGVTWHQHGVAVPDRDTQFSYNAPADGLYWFSLVTIDKQGRRDPADVKASSPALKVVFDTKKPIVNVSSVQRIGDDVTVVWSITERNPEWSKFRLEYSTNGSVWNVVNTRAEAEGSAQFRVPVGPCQVRVSMADVVGNADAVVRDVPGAAAASTASSTASGTMKPADDVVRTGAIRTVAESPSAADRARDSRSTGDSTPERPAGAELPARVPGVPLLPDNSSSATGVFSPTGPIPAPPTGPIASPPTGPIAAPPIAERDPLGTSSGPANLPAAQVINVTSFKLSYDVEDKGASGIGKADVYVTRDDGRTWKLWQTIDKPESPLVIDLSKSAPANVEGVYGLKVQLHSGAGLSREAPRSGEAPDLRVDVDVTAPVVRIYEPTADPTLRDTMILRWQALDRNLSGDPITIEWGDTAKGPWVPVAAVEGSAAGAGTAKRLPNTGSYAWKLPSNFPTHKVYLRVTARDTAGNIAEATTGQPILVDLNKPNAVRLNIVGGISR